MAKGARSAGRKTNVQRTRWLGHKTALPRQPRADKGAAYLKTFGSRPQKEKKVAVCTCRDASSACGACRAGEGAVGGAGWNGSSGGGGT
jgi:hypothetical protein